MRRDINWTTKRDDGSRYDVRVHWFSGTFKLQFKERGAEKWEYDRVPTPEDWATFLDAIERRYTAARPPTRNSSKPNAWSRKPVSWKINLRPEPIC